MFFLNFEIYFDKKIRIHWLENQSILDLWLPIIVYMGYSVNSGKCSESTLHDQIQIEYIAKNI